MRYSTLPSDYGVNESIGKSRVGFPRQPSVRWPYDAPQKEWDPKVGGGGIPVGGGHA